MLLRDIFRALVKDRIRAIVRTSIRALIRDEIRVLGKQSESGPSLRTVSVFKVDIVSSP